MNSDLDKILPNQVQVLFPKLCRGMPQRGFYVASVGLRSFSEFAIAGLNVFGYAGVEIIRDTAWARFGSGGSATPSNVMSLTPLAGRIARDYYHFACGRVDAKLAGVVPWQPEGLTDVIEFVYDVAEESTRLTREPWSNTPQELLHALGGEVDVSYPFLATLHGLGPVYDFTWKEDYSGGGWDSAVAVNQGSRDTSAKAIEANGMMGHGEALAYLWPTDNCAYRAVLCCGGGSAAGSGSGGSGSGCNFKCSDWRTNGPGVLYVFVRNVQILTNDPPSGGCFGPALFSNAPKTLDLPDVDPPGWYEQIHTEFDGGSTDYQTRVHCGGDNYQNGSGFHRAINSVIFGGEIVTLDSVTSGTFLAYNGVCFSDNPRVLFFPAWAGLPANINAGDGEPFALGLADVSDGSDSCTFTADVYVTDDPSFIPP